jgi:hypothetical protein
MEIIILLILPKNEHQSSPENPNLQHDQILLLDGDLAPIVALGFYYSQNLMGDIYKHFANS